MRSSEIMGGELEADRVTGTTAAEISTDDRTNSSKPSAEPMLTSMRPPAVPPIMNIMYNPRILPLVSLVARSFSQLSRTTKTPALHMPLMR